MYSKKVSVVIPCYNAAKWLPKCFLSLVRQTIGIENLQLIFVDDASTDDGATWELLCEFERAYPESILIMRMEENRRQGGARNAALPYAEGEYLAFADADDFAAEDWLLRVYERAVREDADLIQFEYFCYTERTGAFLPGRSVREETICIETAEERKAFLISEKITYGCWNKLYRSSLVRRAGVKYAEGVVYEEPLFVYPLLFYGRRFTVMSEPFYYYRQNETGTMQRDMKQKKTLLMHADVQYQVWEFMKRTEFFREYYEEIKLYFLHTYFYETVYFAALRGLALPMEDYRRLYETVKREVPDYRSTKYETLIPRQLQLYALAAEGMTEEKLAAFMETIG